MHGTDVDIAIGGGGPVGMALAAMLAHAGVAPQRIALIDGRELALAQRDPRSIAVSFGSRQMLEQIGAWPWRDDRKPEPALKPPALSLLTPPSAFAQPSGGATAIDQIHVSRRGSFGRTLISAGDFDLPALGYVIPYGELVTALSQAVQQAGITVMRPVRVLGSEETAESISLTLADRPSLSTSIMVLAEGGVFAGTAPGTDRAVADASLPAVSLHAPASTITSRAYDQTAVIATVRVSAAVAGRAYERFTEEGPLALLPQGDAYALVWCVRPERATVLMNLPEADFLGQLLLAFGGRLGRFVSAGARSTYPLGLKRDGAQSKRRVSIGNAAQTLHPVAGQGLNLGLRDAAVLAQLLARDLTPQALEQFAASRRQDRGAMVRLTDTMARVFSAGADGSTTQGMLGLSLGLIDGLLPAKRLLGDWMMFGHRS